MHHRSIHEKHRRGTSRLSPQLSRSPSTLPDAVMLWPRVVRVRDVRPTLSLAAHVRWASRSANREVQHESNEYGRSLGTYYTLTPVSFASNYSLSSTELTAKVPGRSHYQPPSRVACPIHAVPSKQDCPGPPYSVLRKTP
jgi:hypothetical protein